MTRFYLKQELKDFYLHKMVVVGFTKKTVTISNGISRKRYLIKEDENRGCETAVDKRGIVMFYADEK